MAENSDDIVTNSDELEKKLRSFVADIEAMQMPVRLEEFVDEDFPPEAFFGPFTDYFDESEQSMVQSGSGVRVFWPNLSILLEEAKTLLATVEAERNTVPDAGMGR
jgi:hypothetical protein